MTTHPLISNATDSPLPAGEGLRVRSLPKRQIEVTMFAAGSNNIQSPLDINLTAA